MKSESGESFKCESPFLAGSEGSFLVIEWKP